MAGQGQSPNDNEMEEEEPPSASATNSSQRLSRRKKAASRSNEHTGTPVKDVNSSARLSRSAVKTSKQSKIPSTPSSETNGDELMDDSTVEPLTNSHIDSTPISAKKGKQRLTSAGTVSSKTSADRSKKSPALATDSLRKSASTNDISHSTPSQINDDDDDDDMAPVNGTVTPTTTTTTTVAAPASVVDVTVHRIRSLNYQPKAILCIAATSSSATGTSWMAVSRESGAVELQTVNPKIRTVAVVAGRSNTPMTALTWMTTSTATTANNAKVMNAPTVVLIGANRNDLYVVDFWNTSQLTTKTPVSGGSIFCMQRIGTSDSFAVGCQDGSIRVYSLVISMDLEKSNPKYYQLQHTSTVPSAGAAVLSLACQTTLRKEHATEMSGTVLYAGVADGTIRRYDVAGSSANSTRGKSFSGGSTAATTWKSTLRMTVECYGRSTPTRVWSLLAASDGTVVSGDSLGHVQFWDGTTGTLLRSFDQNDDKADVLALDMSSDECKVFASGVDSRVVCIERSKNNNNTEWVFTQAQRPHTHDVKAVTIVKKFKTWPNSQTRKETEILFTGGIDTKLCTYHVPEFGVRRPRVLYPWPSLKCPIAAASKGRILTILREDRVDLYDLAGPPERHLIMAPQLVSEEDTLIGTVKVKGGSNLSSCAISQNGELLAVSNNSTLLLFHLAVTLNNHGMREVETNQLDVSCLRSCSPVAVHFIQDSCLAVATSQSNIHILSIVTSEDGGTGLETSVCQTLSISPSKGDESPMLPIHSMFGTRDGLWFATFQCSSGSEGGKIDVFRRAASVDAFQLWWTIPSSLGAVITTASFLENMDSPTIAIACVDYTLYLFDLSERRLSIWSEKAGFPLTSKLPLDLACRADFPIRLGINPASPSLVMMGSCGAMVAVNTSDDFPRQCRIFPETHVRVTKRKRSRSFSEQRDTFQLGAPTCTMCLRYNGMMFMSFIADNELVIVEQPWLSVLANFPESLQRKVYGT